MSVSIEGTSEFVSIQHHLIEGTLGRIEDDYVVRGVPTEDGSVDVRVNDLLSQYEGQDVRIVVLSLKDADRLLALAQGMEDGGRNDRG